MVELKRIKKYIGNDQNFYLSYGDGLSDVNINKLTKFHLDKKIATLTAVKYKNPKGVLIIDSKSKIKLIKEKPIEYINGGFFVLSKKIFSYLDNTKIFLRKIVYLN